MRSAAQRRNAITDERRSAPATLRNRAAILAVLRDVLPTAGTVLEVASGSGEHIVHFAAALPRLRWQPSDPAPEARRSIAAWIAAEKANAVLPPIDLDAASTPWPVAAADAVLCINMIHISPWRATEGLMRGAAQVLGQGRPLYLYGPFRRAGHPLAPTNAAFDADLRQRDPAWGLRDLEAVIACARDEGLALDRVVEMPANNLSVVLRRA